MQGPGDPPAVPQLRLSQPGHGSRLQKTNRETHVRQINGSAVQSSPWRPFVSEIRKNALQSRGEISWEKKMDVEPLWWHLGGGTGSREGPQACREQGEHQGSVPWQLADPS